MEPDSTPRRQLPAEDTGDDVVVDHQDTGGATGAGRRLDSSSIPTMHSASAHDANLSTALAFGRAVGVHSLDDRTGAGASCEAGR